MNRMTKIQLKWIKEKAYYANRIFKHKSQIGYPISASLIQIYWHTMMVKMRYSFKIIILICSIELILKISLLRLRLYNK